MLAPEQNQQTIAELVLQVASLRTEILKLQSIVSGQPAMLEGWATAKDAALALRNEGVKDHRHLQRLRLADAFTEGRDIRNLSRGDRPSWQYNVPNCRKALQRHFKRVAG